MREWIEQIDTGGFENAPQLGWQYDLARGRIVVVMEVSWRLTFSLSTPPGTLPALP